MSNDLPLNIYFTTSFKIGRKSDLKMKQEEASHLTQERKHLETVLPCKLISSQTVRSAAHLAGQSGALVFL